MAENMEMPPVDEPQKSNKTLIIVIVVLVVLCCCCLAIGTIGWQFGDTLMYELGLY
jgi:hypothetical protein